MNRHEEIKDPKDAELRLIGTACGIGSCPAVYRTNRGTLIIQGTTVTADEAGISLPAGESLVEIPEELLLTVDRQSQPAEPAA
jgi:hypothetical protein